MFLTVVLVVIGCVSVAVARRIRQGIGHRNLVEDCHGASLQSQWTARNAVVMASLIVAIFVPLLVVAYVAIGVMRHALGQ